MDYQHNVNKFSKSKKKNLGRKEDKKNQNTKKDT